MIDMSTTKDAIKAFKAELIAEQKAYEKGAVRGLNKAAAQGKNQASRIIRKTLNLRASTVKRQLTVKRAKPGKLEARVQASYRAIPLIEWSGLKETRRGYTVRMRKDKPRKLFAGAFKTTLRSGHEGIFKRVPPGRRWTRGRKRTIGTANLPIQEYRGPSVQSVFGERINEISQVSLETLERVLSHEINRALG